ncbi:MAG: PAS domain S-box protein [Candidatus Thermoplasmatota archaeon]|nr:PAS domain S-box protein [Candidatus Thermoplasmatota archaeon]MBS3789524.1 PAS domain S-box protein [Candidatus Thermoplasmatota archaeon]
MNHSNNRLTDSKVQENLEWEDWLEVLSDWVWMMDPEGIHIYSNQAVKEILGYEREEIMGRSAWRFWPDEDREKIKKSEFQNYLKQGKKWTKYPGKFKHKDGSTKILESSAVPIFDEEETLLGYLGIDRDITQRTVVSDREKFLHSLLTHDLRNKLHIAKGCLRLIQEEQLDDESGGYLQRAIASLDAQKDLIDKISSLRRIDKEDTVDEVGLKKHLEVAIHQINAKNDTSDVEIRPLEDDFKVLGGNLLAEVFFNLIENSLKHSRCDLIELKAEPEDKHVVVIFEDNGEGIPDKKKDKIFEKGYKASDSSGSGLGMYLVKRIIDEYNGDISLEDSERGGVKFKIWLKSASQS